MKKYPFFALLLCLPILSHAQTETDTTRIVMELKDGSKLIGIIQTEDSLSVHFLTTGGIAAIVPQIAIRYKYPDNRPPVRTDSIRSGPVIDPSSSRLFFMPTGRPIGTGRGYFSAYELFFPSVGFGIGNLVSLTGGMSMLPGVNDQIYYIAPKITVYHSPVLSLAVGGMSFGADNEAQTDLYAVGTFGNEKAALTVAAHVPTDPVERSNLVIGGELQTSARIKLITENWIFEQSVLYSFGFRFFSERLSADLAFFRSSSASSTSGFPFFPWLGFSYTFGDAEPFPLSEEPAAALPATPWRVRAYYSIAAPRSEDRSVEPLTAQGFSVNGDNGGIFSTGENSAAGSGLLLQAERRMIGPWSAGLTYVTLGELAGTGPQYQAYYSSYNPYYYSLQTEVSRHSSSAFVHAAWTSGGEKERSSLFTIGSGIGRSTVTQEWSTSYYPGPVTGMTRQYSEWSALFFAVIEQRITEMFSIGIDVTYVAMPDTRTNSFTLATVTVSDYSVSPAVQKQITVNIPSSSMNFGFGRIGLGISAGF